MTTEWVRITREQRGSVNGKPLTGRIYVTGPLFGSMDIFSSTAHEWQAEEVVLGELLQACLRGTPPW